MATSPVLTGMSPDKLRQAATKTALNLKNPKLQKHTRSKFLSQSVIESSHRPQSVSLRPPSQQPSKHAEV